MGYYIHGFKLSVYNVKRLADMGKNIGDDVYYKIMCDVCDFGGDTDINCAIVGAMIGPLIGYKNFNKKYFSEFIRFIPYQRCQFNSAFMYVYVNYLEESILKGKQNEENMKKIQTENNNLKEEIIYYTENNNEMVINKNIKTEVKNGETKTKKEEIKKEIKGKKKEEAKNKVKEEVKEIKNKVKEKKDSFLNKVVCFFKKENKNEKFKYTAFTQIKKFLFEDMNI